MSLRAFIRSNPLRFASLIAVAFIHAGTAIFLAHSVADLLDATIGQSSQVDGGAVQSAVVASLAIGLLFVTTTLQRRITDGIGLIFVHDLRLRLFKHVLRAAPGPASAGKRANLLLPFVGDLTAIRQWVGDGVARLALGFGVTILLIGYIAVGHALLAFLLACTIGSLAAFAWIIHSPLDRATRDLRRTRGGLSTFVAGRLEAATTIVAMGRSRSEVAKLERRSRKLTTAALRRAWLVGALRGLSQSSAAVMLVLMLTVVGGEIGQGDMTPGEVMGLVSLTGVIGHALQDMGRSFELFVPGRVAFQRIDRLMALSPRVRRRNRPRRREETGLSLIKLATSAMTQTCNLAAMPGDVVLVDGPAGGGKSALIAVLGGIHAPSAGKVRVNGFDLSALKDAEKQALIGIASPVVPLLPGSVGMNLKYRHPSASTSQVERLIADLGMATMNFDMNRKLAEPRNALSSSEFAAMLLLRAMLGSPPLLLLDAVDGNLPASIAERLSEELANYPGVVIMTAQRHAVRRVATHNWWVSNGAIQVAAGDAGNYLRTSTLREVSAV